MSLSAVLLTNTHFLSAHLGSLSLLISAVFPDSAAKALWEIDLKYFILPIYNNYESGMWNINLHSLGVLSLVLREQRGAAALNPSHHSTKINSYWEKQTADSIFFKVHYQPGWNWPPASGDDWIKGRAENIVCCAVLEEDPPVSYIPNSADQIGLAFWRFPR